MKEVNFHAGVALFGRCLKLEAEYLDEDGNFPKVSTHTLVHCYHVWPTTYKVGLIYFTLYHITEWSSRQVQDCPGQQG